MKTLALVLLLAVPTLGDTVFLKNGSKMDGKVVGEDSAVVTLHVSGGATMTFKFADVDHLELVDRSAAQAELKKRKGNSSPAELLDAARFALFHGLKNDALALMKDLLKNDPDNAEAHALLGHKQLDGKWLGEDEYQQATGHVKRGGKWITAEEASAQDEHAKAAAAQPKPDPNAASPKPPAKVAAGALADPAEDAAILKEYGAGWRVHSGKRYRLVTDCKDSDPKFDQKFVDAMDAQWDVYCAFFGVQPVQKKLHNIVVFASRETYNAWGAKNEPVGNGAYGVYSSGRPFKTASLGYRDGLRAALFTGRHEGCHQFCDHYVYAAGCNWSVEGVACYFEGDIPLNEYPYRWDIVREDLVAGKVTLSDVIAKSDAMAFERTYALGAAVSWFFEEGKGGAYRPGFQKFLQGGHPTSPDALAKSCGVPIATLERDFAAFLAEKEKHSLR